MNVAKSAVTVAALCLMLGVTGAYAQSSEPDSVVGCLHMQKKVSAALDANPQSPNYFAAHNQAQGAASFCAQGLYKLGVSGYARALEILAAN